MGTTVLWECCVGFVYVRYGSYICVHFVNYIQMDMYPLNRGSRSSNECFENISLMGILVNNDLNHVQQVQWEERPGLCTVLCH